MTSFDIAPRSGAGGSPLKKTARISIVLAALIAPACGSDLVTGPSALTGGVWKLRNLQLANYSVVEIADPSRYTVEFRDGGLLAVKADCNACSGSWVSSGGDSLSIGGLACTRAFCGAASQDTAFLALLTTTRAHGVENETLSLYSDGVLRLTR
jgi:heat shock protein HslJ